MSFEDAPPRHRASVSAVLDFAWDTGPFRADHVMAALNLTRSTALSALDDLIDIGLVRELPGGVDDARMGRPARRFELRGEAGVVVGLDVGERHFHALAADLTGHVVGRGHRVMAATGPVASQDPAARRSTALAAIDAALDAAGRARADVVAVGVGVPAPVNGRGTSPENPGGFWRTMNPDLQAFLEREFPAVRVENDAALAALAEASIGEARRCDHFVAMLSGRRLGSGVFLEGRLVRGAHGGVGELEGLSHVPGVGGTWGLGHVAEQWALHHLADADIPAGHAWSRLSLNSTTAEELLAAATLADPVTRPLLEHLGALLGKVCTVVARFYDPEIIVVCGAMAGALGEVIEVAQAALEQEVELPSPVVVASRLGGDVVGLGAVAAAREAARDAVLALWTARRQASP